MNNKKLKKLASFFLVFCGAASADQNSNEVFIEAPIEKVYSYVAQPDRWHEWHPASINARSETLKPLIKGDRFSEKIRIYGQETEMNYEVVIASPPNEFKTVFTSPLIDGTINYRLKKTGNGTLFQRTLEYSLEKYIITMKGGMNKMSETALKNLKKNLEGDL
ncbi:SRPBCC family protein [Pseudomonas simiae]|uniref:SRPBCC family protein n=1 Tax=Pseudomonas simiae TaxID=321846 RepID=UPI003D6AE179